MHKVHNSRHGWFQPRVAESGGKVCISSTHLISLLMTLILPRTRTLGCHSGLPWARALCYPFNQYRGECKEISRSVLVREEY